MNDESVGKEELGAMGPGDKAFDKPIKKEGDTDGNAS
jgi:hypothetical protein